MPLKRRSKQSPKEIEAVDYEQLGRMLETVFMTGYVNRARYFRMAFLRGVFTGLGSIIGATIVVALLLWVLSIFEVIPLIGPVLEDIQQAVEPASQP